MMTLFSKKYETRSVTDDVSSEAEEYRSRRRKCHIVTRKITSNVLDVRCVKFVFSQHQGIKLQIRGGS